MNVVPLERDYTEPNSRLRLMYFREGESEDGEGGKRGRPGGLTGFIFSFIFTTVSCYNIFNVYTLRMMVLACCHVLMRSR